MPTASAVAYRRRVIRQLSARQLVTDIILAAVFFLLTGFVGVTGSMWSLHSVATVLVGIFMAGALSVRRLAPGLSLAIAWAGALLQMSAGLDPMVSNVAILGVLYVTAAYGTRLVFWLGFASTLVGALVMTLYLYIVRAALGIGIGLSWQSITLAGVVWVAASFGLLLCWTIGALVRTAQRARDNRAAQIRAEQEAASEQERVRIARDMHDVVAHSLAVVIAQADGARYAAAADPSAATTALGTISTTARAALADVRLLLTQLRHSQGDGPQPTLADLEALYAQVRAAGADLRVSVAPTPVLEPPAAVQLAVYRILQEALTNALRHGAAAGPGGAGIGIDVRLAWYPDRVDLMVANPMRTDAAPGAGHGVIGMRERAQLVGGSFEAGADAGCFVVRATLPVDARFGGAGAAA
jgi:signal transduction histidine kinase